jgi:DNA-binding beta-propeller fold protein YncE
MSAIRKLFPSAIGISCRAMCYCALVGAVANSPLAAQTLFVSDDRGTTIDEVSPTGEVTTFASGLSSAVGVVFDAGGNLYVANSVTSGAKVFKITPAGVMTTVATYSSGLAYPTAIAIDESGNLYVANALSGTISSAPAGTVTKITPGGAVSTFVSGGLSYPQGLAFDGSGNLYIANGAVGTISKVTPGGTVTTFASALSNVAGLAFDSSGNLYVANLYDPYISTDTSTGPFSGGGNILKITPAGVISIFAPSVNPFGLAFDGSGNLYVSNGNYLIQDGYGGTETISKISPDGATTTFASNLDFPEGLAFDGGGNLYVGGHAERILKIAPGGAVTTLPTGLDYPEGLAFDGNGNLYVANEDVGTISVITPAGAVSPFASGLKNPVGLVFDSSGNLYCANGWLDSSPGTISKISPSGLVTTFATGLDSGCDGLAIDAAGNLYVVNETAGSIQKVAPDGTVKSFASGLSAVYSLAIDGNGNLYAPSWVFSGLYVIAPDGTVTEYNTNFSAEGTTVDGEGNLYFSVDGYGQTPSGAYFGGIVKIPTTGSVPDLSAAVDFADGERNLGFLLLPSFVAIQPPPPLPRFPTQPVSQSIESGATAVFTVVASDSPISYQWMFSDDGGGTWTELSDGGGISGSAGPQLMISGASAADVGEYEVVVSNAAGSATSAPATLQVVSSASPGFLVNISSRAFVGTGDSILIGGFFVGGSTSRSVLIQALGPALTAQGVSGVLQHPALTIHNSSGAVIYSDTGWGSNPVLLKAAASAYAQPVLQPDSADSEVLLTLPPGGYTAEIAGADGGTGVALCAIYQLP